MLVLSRKIVGSIKKIPKKITEDALAGKSARLFENGGSQCVRIPKDLRFPGEVAEVVIDRDEHGGLVLRPSVVLAPDLQALANLWSEDPRAAFEKVIPEGERLFPKRGMGLLLQAGVLPFRPAPNGIKDDGGIMPSENRRWSFWFENHGWLDGWKLYTQLRQDEYFVMALVGLEVPLDQVARAMSQVSGRSAWSGLGGVGWLWAYSRDHRTDVEQGVAPWWSHFQGLDEMVEDRNRAVAEFSLKGRVKLDRISPLMPMAETARLLGEEVNKGHGLVLFAARGTGARKLAEWLAAEDPEILTPERIEFDDYTKRDAMQGVGKVESGYELPVFGPFLGQFLAMVMKRRPIRPFVVVVKTLEPIPTLKDWAKLVRSQETWPMGLPESFHLVGIGKGQEGPEVLWNYGRCGLAEMESIEKEK